MFVTVPRPAQHVFGLGVVANFLDRPNDSGVADEDRVRALERCTILDTAPEHAFDRCIFTAAQLCRAPLAVIALLDGHRSWCKAAVGPAIPELAREQTMCWTVVTTREELLVEDVQAWSKFSTLAVVTSTPNVRFYFGLPLWGPERQVVGALCVIDTKPRTMSDQQIRGMRHIAAEVGELIRLRIPDLDLEGEPPLPDRR